MRGPKGPPLSGRALLGDTPRRSRKATKPRSQANLAVIDAVKKSKRITVERDSRGNMTGARAETDDEEAA